MVLWKWGLLHNSFWNIQWFVGFNAKAFLQNSDHFCPFGKVRVVLITCGTYSVWLLRLSQFLAPEYDYDWLCILQPNLQNRNQLFLLPEFFPQCLSRSSMWLFQKMNEKEENVSADLREFIGEFLSRQSCNIFQSSICPSIEGFSKPHQTIIQVVSVPAGKMRSPPFSSMS